VLHILFQLGPDRYALPANAVMEVLPLVALKQLPGAARGVAGLMDFRGTAVPVVDLTELALGRPARRLVSTRLLIVRYAPAGAAPALLGLIAERATEMLRKAAGEFQAAGVATPGARFLGPVAPDRRGLIQRIEIDALLTDEVRAALFAATTEGARP